MPALDSVGGDFYVYDNVKMAKILAPKLATTGDDVYLGLEEKRMSEALKASAAAQCSQKSHAHAHVGLHCPAFGHTGRCGDTRCAAPALALRWACARAGARAGRTALLAHTCRLLTARSPPALLHTHASLHVRASQDMSMMSVERCDFRSLTTVAGYLELHALGVADISFPKLKRVGDHLTLVRAESRLVLGQWQSSCDVPFGSPHVQCTPHVGTLYVR